MQLANDSSLAQSQYSQAGCNTRFGRLVHFWTPLADVIDAMQYCCGYASYIISSATDLQVLCHWAGLAAFLTLRCLAASWVTV